MKRTRFFVIALVLSFAFAASFEAAAVTAGGGVDAAKKKKKCKKGYKRNKKGKCKKKKVTPKLGFFIGQAAGNEVRLRLGPKTRPAGGGAARQYLNLFSGVFKFNCSNGTQKTYAARGTGVLRGKKFTPFVPNQAQLNGSFKTATRMSGTIRAASPDPTGGTCDTGAVKFTAKWAGK